MMFAHLSFSVLLGYLQQGIAGLEDPRLPSNSRRHSPKEVVLGAFLSFFMQNESLKFGTIAISIKCLYEMNNPPFW